jgi:hypothetical protein
MPTLQETGEALRLFMSGVVKGNLPDTLGAPIDLLHALSPKSLQSGNPALGSKHIREIMFGKDQVEDANVAETAGSFLSAGGAVKAMIIGAARLGKLSEAAKGLNDKALGMVEAGAKNSDLFNTTGRYVDSLDGKLKAVISDKASKIKDPTGQVLGQVLDHPELYRLYPELKNIPIKVDPKAKIPGGSFNPTTGIEARAPNIQLLREVILHETQHGVQNIEGFTRGGNIQQFLDFAPGLLQESITKGKKSSDPSVRDAAERFKNKANEKIQEAIRSYENLGGEQEARFTQASRDLDYTQVNTVVSKLLKQNQTPQSFDTR